MSEITPGPWDTWLDPIEGMYRIRHPIEANRIIVAIGVVKEADAHLIAAAPDMLAALTQLSAGMNDSHDSNPAVKADEVRQARAAIAKATA